jgi:hypothetical protein
VRAIIQKLGAPSARSRPDENPVNTIWATDHSIDSVNLHSQRSWLLRLPGLVTASRARTTSELRTIETNWRPSSSGLRSEMLCEANQSARSPSSHEGWPVLPEENNAIKAAYSRRLLTENGLSSVDLESRFYAVHSKAALSGLALNPRRSKSREPKRPKAAKVFERAESIEMAFLRLVGIK